MTVIVCDTPPAQVHLISVGAGERELAMVTRGYSQVYEPDIPEEDVQKFLEDLKSTKLQTPNAFVNTVWLLKNVTRNFEQQLTRYRVGTAFVCESLRFSDKRDAVFYRPPFKGETSRHRYELACRAAIHLYESFIEAGEETQNARAILPSSICTHLFLSINLQALAHIYEQRACCQAQQEEWREVLGQMASRLESSHPAFREMLRAPWDNPLCVDCGFRASFDRKCSRQDLFDSNLRTLSCQRLGG